MSCPACFQGKERTDAEPTGTVSKVYGRDTYTAEPPSGAQPKGIVVIIPDAFGWEFKNNRLLADEYARQGQFRVYLPDFMDGRAAPLWLIDSMDKVILDTSWTGIATKPYHIFWTMYGFIPFRMGNTIKATMPRVNSFLSSIRGSADSALPVGCAGFCWGGQHVVRLGLGDSVDPATKLPLSDSLFTAHPSSVTEADFKHIKRPISVASGSKDIVTSLDMIRKAEAALRQSGAKHEVVIYEGARHGWSVRIDRANPKLKEQAEEAERQAVNWFSKTFADVKR